jgi:hypothetical protein
MKDMQRHRHPVNGWMRATLDGIIGASEAVYEAKFMLPWSFSKEGAAEKHMAQLQHNMWVVNPSRIRRRRRGRAAWSLISSPLRSLLPASKTQR